MCSTVKKKYSAVKNNTTTKVAEHNIIHTIKKYFFKPVLFPLKFTRGLTSRSILEK